MSRLFRFLSNPDTKLLHSKCRKIVILILETFSIDSHFDFFNLTFELILALEGNNSNLKIFCYFKKYSIKIFFWFLLDLSEFDKEFFEKNHSNQRILKRFNVELDSSSEINVENIQDQNKFLAKHFILIENLVQCYSLQENIT